MFAFPSRVVNESVVAELTTPDSSAHEPALKVRFTEPARNSGVSLEVFLSTRVYRNVLPLRCLTESTWASATPPPLRENSGVASRMELILSGALPGLLKVTSRYLRRFSNPVSIPSTMVVNSAGAGTVFDGGSTSDGSAPATAETSMPKTRTVVRPMSSIWKPSSPPIENLALPPTSNTWRPLTFSEACIWGMSMNRTSESVLVTWMAPVMENMPATDIVALPPKLRIFWLVGKLTGTLPAGVQTDSLTEVPS